MLKSFDIAVLSPGVPLDIPFGRYKMKASGMTDLGRDRTGICPWQGANVVAITGTNGKTTTTTLVGAIMARHSCTMCAVVGNIGIPYTSVAEETTDDTVVVAEISSFQLGDHRYDLHPKAAAILNITPDHLNRHHTMANYIAAKESMAKNQTSG